MIRQFLLFLALAVVLSVTGCGGKNGSERYFAYRAEGFRAEVRGRLDGTEIVAEVVYAPRGTSAVRYLAPASLAGLCVERGSDGAARATLDGLTFAADADTLSGLLRPLTLLSACSTEVRAVQKSDGKATLSLSDGVTLTLLQKGVPLCVSDANVRLEVLSFSPMPTK